MTTRRIVTVLDQGRSQSDGLATFVVLAWGTTWLLALPLAAAWLRGLPGEPWRIALAGLSAFGPSSAAFLVARRQRRLGAVFGRFRTSPIWVALALLTPLFLHLVAKLVHLAFGGRVTQWFWLPQTSAQVAALFVFSLGEEFGWRGFAHPIFLRRYGPILGPLATGLVWGIWHLFYSIAPDGSFHLAGFALTVLELMLWAVVIAWLFERTNRSMAVALAIHAGGHLDKARVSAEDWRLKALTLLVLAVAAAIAARAFSLRSSGEAC